MGSPSIKESKTWDIWKLRDILIVMVYTDLLQRLHGSIYASLQCNKIHFRKSVKEEIGLYNETN